MKTPEPKFLLKEPKSKTETLISMFFRFDNQRLVYSTGEKVNPKDWDAKKQKVKSTRGLSDGESINNVLDQIATISKEIFREYKLNEKFVSPIVIKKELEDRMSIKTRKEDTTLFGFIEKYIEESKREKKESTIKTYLTTLKHLQDFNKKRSYPIEFETIDLEFYNKFKDYLSFELGLALNSVGKQIKNLNTFLNSATAAGINQNLTFREKGFKKLTEDVNHIYLNDTEIEAIYKLNLSYNITWEEVRDIFVIGCQTGLRFHDLSCLREHHIKKELKGEMIEFDTNKTGQKVIIPVAKRVKEILEKYNYQLPKVITNQKFNLYLKSIAELAKIKDDVEIIKTVGGKKQSLKYKKFELVTAHTARRSFATNVHLAGIASIDNMKMTGHKTESSFLKYIKTSQQENALKLMEHPYFKK